MAKPIAIHIFAGNDDYTALQSIQQWKRAFAQKHSLAATIEIDGDGDATALQTAISSVIGTPSLFATATLVIIRQPFAVTDKESEKSIEQLCAAAAPNELVIVGWHRGDPDKRRTLYKKIRGLILDGSVKWHQVDVPKGTQLVQWIVARARSKGVVCPTDAATQIAQLLTTEPLWAVANAVDLLATVADGRVTRDLVRAYVLPRTLVDSFGVTDAIAAGNQQQTLAALGNYTLQRNPSISDGVALLGALTWMIRTAARIQDGSAQRVNPYVVRKIEPFARRLTAPQLVDVWQLATRADQKVKQGKQDVVSACEELVWALIGS